MTTVRAANCTINWCTLRAATVPFINRNNIRSDPSIRLPTYIRKYTSPRNIQYPIDTNSLDLNRRLSRDENRILPEIQYFSARSRGEVCCLPEEISRRIRAQMWRLLNRGMSEGSGSRCVRGKWILPVKITQNTNFHAHMLVAPYATFISLYVFHKLNIHPRQNYFRCNLYFRRCLLPVTLKKKSRNNLQMHLVECW